MLNLIKGHICQKTTLGSRAKTVTGRRFFALDMVVIESTIGNRALCDLGADDLALRGPMHQPAFGRRRSIHKAPSESCIDRR